MPRQPHPHWFRMLFAVRGSVLPRIALQLFLTFAMGCWAMYASTLPWPWNLGYTPAPFGFLGVSLAVFLGFRNSAAYDRWWEARKLWGLVVINTRSLGREALSLVDSPARARRLIGLSIAFAHAMRHRLQETDARMALAPWLAPADIDAVLAVRSPPQAVLGLLSRELAEARRAGEVNPVLLPAMEERIGQLEFALGSCERLAFTPMPFTYAVIIHRTVHLYCIALPFGLAQTVGLLTPVVTTFVAYPFFALEALAQEIEDPFGESINAIGLEEMVAGIERELRGLMAQADAGQPPIVRVAG
ncbi:bestrophin family protein [Derxia gummosa]|uniref:Bestrophin family protein n=1 Tax=Derxia gummosa DSM 723 TaxID=1121388 RepID=A0A8B6X7B5_9BURK|nr:bestrophin family ion channel [Derxia gummosa]